jgi:signal transduction histidine kinase
MQKSFVSNASHELRTPLASITSQVEVVLLNKRKESEYKEVLLSVLEEAKGLTNLANNLLEIARSGQELSTMTVDKVRLDELLLQSQSELSIRKPECTIDIDILDNSGDEDHDFSVMGNENLLKLIFVNLIDNACKFSNNKPVKVTVDYRKNDAKLSFKDQGIGIPDDELDHVFEPFFRAKNAHTKKGHGIGLSLIANIVKLHKGSISIKSEIGSGTLIEVYLPYKLD